MRWGGAYGGYVLGSRVETRDNHVKVEINNKEKKTCNGKFRP